MDDFDTAQNHAGVAKFPRSEHRIGASFDGSTPALDNIVQVLRGWADSSWIRMMPENQDLDQALSEQRVMEGDPKFEASQDVPVGAIRLLRSVDCPQWHLGRRRREMGATCDEAVTAVRPDVIDVRTDPNIGLWQPHITFAQAKVLASALIEDYPTRGNVIVGVAKQVLEALLPSHHQR